MKQGLKTLPSAVQQKFGHVCECRGVRRRRRRGGGAPFRTCSGGRGGGAPDNQERVPAAQLRRAKRAFARNRTLFLANGTSEECRRSRRVGPRRHRACATSRH